MEIKLSENNKIATNSTTKIRIHSFLKIGGVEVDGEFDLKDVPEHLRGMAAGILLNSRVSVFEPIKSKEEVRVDKPKKIRKNTWIQKLWF